MIGTYYDRCRIHDVHPVSKRLIDDDNPLPETALTIEEVRLHCRLDADDITQDVPLQGYMRSAEEAARKIADRTCLEGPWIQYMDAFPSEIVLQNSPCVSVTSIKYIDQNGTEQTLSSSLYTTDLISEPARINPSYGNFWPVTRCQTNVVYVQYVAGYADATTVPPDMKTGMAHLIAHWFENREPLSEVAMSPLSWTGEQLIRGCWTGWAW